MRPPPVAPMIRGSLNPTLLPLLPRDAGTISFFIGERNRRNIPLILPRCFVRMTYAVFFSGPRHDKCLGPRFLYHLSERPPRSNRPFRGHTRPRRGPLYGDAHLARSRTRLCDDGSYPPAHRERLVERLGLPLGGVENVHGRRVECPRRVVPLIHERGERPRGRNYRRGDRYRTRFRPVRLRPVVIRPVRLRPHFSWVLARRRNSCYRWRPSWRRRDSRGMSIPRCRCRTSSRPHPKSCPPA